MKNHPFPNRLNTLPYKSNFRKQLGNYIKKQYKRKSKIDWSTYKIPKISRCKIPPKKPKMPPHSAMKNCIAASYDAMLLAKEFAKISAKAAVQGKPVKHGVNSCMRNLASSVRLSLTGDCYNRALNSYFDKFMGRMKTKMSKKGWLWDSKLKIFKKDKNAQGGKKNRKN